jgi:glucosylceramidase
MTTPPQIRCSLTARDEDARLDEVPAAASPGTDPAAARIVVDTRRVFQTVLGFGGAFTESAAHCWRALGPDARREMLRAYFDPAHGHGYTLCRVHMGSCDFSLGNYAHAARHGDLALESFSIERDRDALLPFIRAARAFAGREIRLLASPWSPPAWMKTTGRMNGGGALRPECRAAWAQCYARFIAAYADEGIPIWGVSVQNEPLATQPWDSCIYTAEEERDFVRDHLGPTLVAAGLGHVKIVIWDHNRDLMVERARTVYSDPAAAAYVWGTGFHWYGEEQFDNVQAVHDEWPDKALLFTEGCQEGGPHIGSWELGERYAHSMINDLNRWTVGWIDWNLALDMGGGPNHVGNYCSAPILVDTAGGVVLRQSSYYYIGHFARFVWPGARRVACEADGTPLEACAFLNADGSMCAVVLNRTEQEQAFSLEIDGARVTCQLPSRAIATYRT